MTTPAYAPRLRARRLRELELEDAAAWNWPREVEGDGAGWRASTSGLQSWGSHRKNGQRSRDAGSVHCGNGPWRGCRHSRRAGLGMHDHATFSGRSANSRSLVELGNLARLAKGCGGLTARSGSERVSGLSPPKRRREPAGPDPDEEAIDDARHLREQGHP